MTRASASIPIRIRMTMLKQIVLPARCEERTSLRHYLSSADHKLRVDESLTAMRAVAVTLKLGSCHRTITGR